MKGCSTAFMLVGGAVSVGALSAAIGGDAIGWALAIIVMLTYWVGVPKLLEKYDDHRKDPQTKAAYFEKHPEEFHCPNCYSVLVDFIGQKYDGTTDTIVKAYKCSQCGHTYLTTKSLAYNDGASHESYATGVFDEHKKVDHQNNIALIDCPACGHKVSNQAPACPNCGQPIKPPEVPRPAATSTSKFCCPKCHSTDYRKIDSLERAASAQLWGVGSGKIGKQYKCNKCGHMW